MCVCYSPLILRWIYQNDPAGIIHCAALRFASFQFIVCFACSRGHRTQACCNDEFRFTWLNHQSIAFLCNIHRYMVKHKIEYTKFFFVVKWNNQKNSAYFARIVICETWLKTSIVHGIVTFYDFILFFDVTLEIIQREKSNKMKFYDGFFCCFT